MLYIMLENVAALVVAVTSFRFPLCTRNLQVPRSFGVFVYLFLYFSLILTSPLSSIHECQFFAYKLKNFRYTGKDGATLCPD